jgi:peptidoglycan/xylan/chitin deacetylase (PgdA/CDA1 family)
MYHAIDTSDADPFAVSPALFAAEMQYLHDNGYQVVSLRRAHQLLHANACLRKHIALTFDDGYQDSLTQAAPILQRYGFTATLFVVSGKIGQTSTWSRFNKTRPLLRKDDLKTLKTMGWTLGSHSVTHADLTTLAIPDLEHELAEARAAVADLGETFLPFAYPGGRFTRRERDAVQRAGYDCAVIVGGRWGNGPDTNRFALKREPMLASDSLDWFQKRVSGFYEMHYLWARARGVQTR